MANKYTVMSEEAIRYMCGLIRDVVSLPSEIISNINLADNLTFSNIYIKDLVEQCLMDAKDYADLICGSLIKLTCKKTTVQPTLDNSELNIIYLFSSDGNAPYEQYLKISDTELIDMGSTSINLNDYLTVTDAVSTYAKKVDLDTLTTEVTNIKSDLTTHTGDTDVHTSATEKASYALKSKITDTIDSLSTSDDIASAKGVYEALKNDKTIGVDYTYENSNSLNINLTKAGLYKIANPTEGVPEGNPQDYTLLNIPWRDTSTIMKFGYQMLFTPRRTYYWVRRVWNYNPSTYTYTEGDYSVFGKWQKVCSTTVQDISVTNISMSSTYTSNANCKYQVVNGVCYIDFMSGTYKLTSNVNGVILATGLPIPKTGQTCTTYVPWSCADASKQVIIFVNGYGELILHASVNANATPMFCTFSYPVKES